MSKEEHPLVSIITLNYNQATLTCDLLRSLQVISYPNIEVIVVDNASKENPARVVLECFPKAQFIRSDENLGFAGGNNIGIKEAKGKYVLLLNNDTEVAPDFLEPLVNCMEQDAKIGVCSPKIRFFQTKVHIQYAGSTAINPLRVASYAIGSKEEDKGQYDQAGGFTHLAHGAAMMVSREAMNKAGLMEESFFLYYEELDWCEHIKRAGFEIHFVPQSLVLHKESMSVGKNSHLQLYYKTRNRVLFARRNLKGTKLLLALTYLLMLVAPVRLGKFLLKGNFKSFKVYLKAICWHSVLFKSYSTFKR